MNFNVFHNLRQQRDKSSLIIMSMFRSETIMQWKWYQQRNEFQKNQKSIDFGKRFQFWYQQRDSYTNKKPFRLTKQYSRLWCITCSFPASCSLDSDNSFSLKCFSTLPMLKEADETFFRVGEEERISHIMWGVQQLKSFLHHKIPPRSINAPQETSSAKSERYSNKEKKYLLSPEVSLYPHGKRWNFFWLLFLVKAVQDCSS